MSWVTVDAVLGVPDATFGAGAVNDRGDAAALLRNVEPTCGRTVVVAVRIGFAVATRYFATSRNHLIWGVSIAAASRKNLMSFTWLRAPRYV
jgi:hypothetical protein